jgi:hypothetical protein
MANYDTNAASTETALLIDKTSAAPKRALALRLGAAVLVVSAAAVATPRSGAQVKTSLRGASAADVGKDMIFASAGGGTVGPL